MTAPKPTDIWWRSVSKAGHTVVAGVGAAAQVALLLQPVLHGTALHWVQAVLAVATALGVHLAPKAAPTPSGDPTKGTSA